MELGQGHGKKATLRGTVSFSLEMNPDLNNTSENEPEE